jgi:hypothetical protein
MPTGYRIIQVIHSAASAAGDTIVERTDPDCQIEILTAVCPHRRFADAGGMHADRHDTTATDRRRLSASQPQEQDWVMRLTADRTRIPTFH